MREPKSDLLGQSERFCASERARCWRRPDRQYHWAQLLSVGSIGAKDIPFASPEGLRLQFQADAFNAFNRANWNNPNVGNAGSSTFGQITGSLPARVLQFGGKVNF